MNARRTIERPCRWVAAHQPLLVFIWWALVAAATMVSCEPVLAAESADVRPSVAAEPRGRPGGVELPAATRAAVGQAPRSRAGGAA